LKTAPLAALNEPPKSPGWLKVNEPFSTLTTPALVKSTLSLVTPLPCDFLKIPLLSIHGDPD
jgi:hypothetical protein